MGLPRCPCPQQRLSCFLSVPVERQHTAVLRGLSDLCCQIPRCRVVVLRGTPPQPRGEVSLHGNDKDSSTRQYVKGFLPGESYAFCTRIGASLPGKLQRSDKKTFLDT